MIPEEKRNYTRHKPNPGDFKSGHIPWHTGKSVTLNTGRTWFKKGFIPWNKGKEYVNIKGKNNHNWKGGISGENKILRHSLKYKLWRKFIFERDKYTCQRCGIKGGYLEANHIKQWAKYPESRFDVNNGETVCRQCHHIITWGW